MPKIIPNIRSRILQSARRQLAEGGYPSLSLRGVAKDCGIALGTTYHYFQNKQDLAIEVLREDWNNEVIAEIQIDPSTMAPENVSVKFYSLLGKFCSKYNHVLLYHRSSDDMLEAVRVEQRAIVNDTVSFYRLYLSQYQIQETDAMLDALAETSVHFAFIHTEESVFRQFAKIYLQSKQ